MIRASCFRRTDSGGLSRIWDSSVDSDEIQYLCHRGQRPGADIEQIQRFKGVETGEDRVNPYDPKYAGAQYDHYRGDGGFAQTAGGGEGAVHECGHAIGDRKSTRLNSSHM